MTSVLVVNHAHSAVCGIHDLGKRIHDCLSRSLELEVSYAECASAADFDAVVRGTDVVIVNYRADLTPWAATHVDAVTFAVLHQYEEATADARAAELLGCFDHVLALDPRLRRCHPRVHAVGRPIPETVEHGGQSDIPQIGSFGFAFPHKGFADVAAEIASLGRPATYNLHMPEAYFNGAHGQPLYTDGIIGSIMAANDGFMGSVTVHHTAEHLAERELVHRLSMNDVNCLFYVPGQPDAGLSSAIDYLIAARRPMLVSGAAMFRHAWNAPIWPDVRLADILNNYDHYQQEADVLYNSMAGQLVRDVEKIVSEL